jgi:hypothetical protein
MVTPRFKLRSEGEPVRWGDQLVLMSKKFNMSLHVSTSSFDDGRFEANASNDATRNSWRILPYAPFVADADSLLHVCLLYATAPNCAPLVYMPSGGMVRLAVWCACFIRKQKAS